MFNKIAFASAAMLALGVAADESIKCVYRSESGVYDDSGVAAFARARFTEHEDDGSTTYSGIFKNGNANTVYTWALYAEQPAVGQEGGAEQELFRLRTCPDGKANARNLVIFEEDEGGLEDLEGWWIGISCEGTGVVAACTLE